MVQGHRRLWVSCRVSNQGRRPPRWTAQCDFSGGCRLFGVVLPVACTFCRLCWYVCEGIVTTQTPLRRGPQACPVTCLASPDFFFFVRFALPALEVAWFITHSGELYRARFTTRETLVMSGSGFFFYITNSPLRTVTTGDRSSSCVMWKRQRITLPSCSIQGQKNMLAGMEGRTAFV